MKEILDNIENKLEDTQDIILLLVRLILAFIFIQAGWGKIINFERTLSFFSSLGIPLPFINTIMATATEFLGGILILLGLKTRLAAVPLTITMIVATLTAHSNDPLLETQTFFYGLLFFIIIGTGAGKYSLDSKK